MKEILFIVDAVSPDASAASSAKHSKVVYNLSLLDKHFPSNNNDKLLATKDGIISKIGAIGYYIYAIILDPNQEMSMCLFAILKDSEDELKRFCNNLPNKFYYPIIELVKNQQLEGFSPNFKVFFEVRDLA